MIRTCIIELMIPIAHQMLCPFTDGTVAYILHMATTDTGLPFVQLLGVKFMQIGGSILKIDRIADGTVHIPSPQIKPEATAPA